MSEGEDSVMEAQMPNRHDHKGKQRMAEEDVHQAAIHDEDELHETEIDFDLVNLDDEHDDEAFKMIFKQKNAQISELQTNLERYNFIIAYVTPFFGHLTYYH